MCQWRTVVYLALFGVNSVYCHTLEAQKGRLVDAENLNLPYNHPQLVRDESRIVEQVHIGAGAQPDEVPQPKENNTQINFNTPAAGISRCRCL